MCQCGGKCGNNCSCGKEGKEKGTCSCHSNEKPKLLFCIVGKSASGKDTLCKTLYERLGWKSICSYTDRPIRVSETQGVEHQFVSKEEMDTLLSQDNIIAETQIGEYRYCATTDCIDNDTKLYIVDPAGVEYLSKKKEKLGINICVVYLDVDSDIRLSRALARGDVREVAEKRFNDEDKTFDDFALHLVSGYCECPFFMYANDGNFEELYIKVGSSILEHERAFKGHWLTMERGCCECD